MAVAAVRGATDRGSAAQGTVHMWHIMVNI